MHDDVDDPIIHGVNNIAVDPEDFDKIYITCNSSVGGEYDTYSAGVFKSVDGGDTWDELIIPEADYPAGWDYALRKIVIDPENPEILYLITYRNVFRSLDEGDNWTKIFSRDFMPWDLDPYKIHKGFFDFKITPWDENRRAYLAGSEIYTVGGLENNEPQFEDISTNVFDIQYEGTRYGNPLRCEISMDKHHNNTVWFFYTCEYDKGEGDGIKRYHRIVKFDGNNYSLIYEDPLSYCDPGYSDFKLEFSVSPSDPNTFYAGGTGLVKIVPLQDPTSFGIKYGSYPDDCWVHDDIREMQIFSDGLKDTLFIADDSGISWGTAFDEGQTTCNWDKAWNWRHPCITVENGLNFTELYGIGTFNKSSELVAMGCQDLGNMLLNGSDCFNFGEGDGCELVWDTEDQDILYFSDFCNHYLFRTNDQGRTYDHGGFYTFSQNGLFIPMEMDPWNKSVLYSGEDHLLKFSGVDIFPDPPAVTDLLNTTFLKPLSDIEAVKVGYNARRLYFSTLMVYYTIPPQGTVGCLYKTIGDGNNITYEDIGKNLDGCNHGFINDIEVKPDAISTIWVSFAVYSFNGDPKVFRTLDEGAHWEDYSQGLPPGFPVFKLKFDPQFNNLYAATDVGVFVRNINDIEGEWNSFDNNLPKKIVTDLDLNLATIYAATYGRGLWKSPLHCHYDSEPFTLAGDLTWTTNKIMETTIIIPAGKTLEISNCSVFMPSEAKIVVERGGQLILDGGTLSSACNDLWWGVELQGDSRNIQTEDYQGKIVLKNNAVIEDARKAVFCGKNIENTYPDWNFTGGIIDATSSTFQNNKFGVLIWRYNDQDRDYNSTLSECKFLTTKALKDGLPPRYFLTLIQVNGTHVEACDFINSTPDNKDYQDRGTGIFAYDGGFDVTSISQIQRSRFWNLNYGIHALNYEQDLSFTVDNAIFDNNLTGVYASGLSEIKLYDNDFNIPRAEYPNNRIFGGVYLNYCTGYTMTENHFDGITPGGETKVGITINNSGEAYNVINSNYFSSLSIGTLAQNVNRSKDPDIGLKILCNTYSNDEYDITITGYESCNGCGISEYQGASGAPAGNLFSRRDSPGFYDYYNEMSPITYFHHYVANYLDPPDWYPLNTSPLPFIDKENTSLYWNEEYCGNRIIESEDKIILKDLYLTNKSVSDSLKASLAELIDGGNTDALEMDITFAQPEEALEIKDELMDNSPYLSDTILIKSAEKEDVLAPVMVKEIMVANPQSAKSEKVMAALENRENPLPEYMMQEILEGRDSLAQKEILEAELSDIGLQKEIALNRLITIFKEDTLSTRLDSIISLLQNHQTLTSSYRLVMTCLEKEDTISAINTLDTIPTQFDLSSDQELIHEHWAEWVEILIDMNADSLLIFNPDTTIVERIFNLAQFDDKPGCLAKNTLHFLGIMETGPSYILPWEQLKSFERKSDSKIRSTSFLKPYIKLYPNPAKNYLVVEYNVMNISVDGLLDMYAANGKIQFTKRLDGNKHDYIINTKDWSDGIYFYNFTNGCDYKQSGKVIISR